MLVTDHTRNRDCVAHRSSFNLLTKLKSSRDLPDHPSGYSVPNLSSNAGFSQSLNSSMKNHLEGLLEQTSGLLPTYFDPAGLRQAQGGGFRQALEACGC